MTFTHDDIRDRLVDFLYGQLDGEARAAFQAHLDGCAACREEVGGVERARVVAREVVRRPLGDAVPERVRTRAFEAARAAVAARAAAVPAQAQTAVRPPAVEGWFSRLRRRWTWTFPTFATVAAMAVFLLVRATIFREAKTPVTAERARELARPAETVAAPAAPPTPAAAEPPPAAVYRDGAAQRLGDREAPEEAAAKPAAPAASEGVAGGARHRRRRAPASAAHDDSLDQLSDLSSSSASRGAGAAQPAPVLGGARRKMAPQKEALPEDDALLAAPGGSSDRRPRASAKADSAGRADDRESNARESNAGVSRQAPEAPQRAYAAPPPPPAPAAAPLAKGGGAPMMDVEEGALASDEPPAEQRKAGKKSKTAKDKEPIAHVAAPEPSSRTEADEKAAAPAPDPALVRGSRAESLMNQRRWGEAITILRDLLRRYPSHPAVPRWRSLLEAAQAGQNATEDLFATPPPPR